ncbi:hypothetical protein M3Y97_00998900 [Aphelenchoides bicaudatus]|nr:hypothetical protein M3Y97_00998900 [Aphelenchoides bicaudatus]
MQLFFVSDDIGPFLYDLIENGTIDLVAQPLQITDKRSKRFSFTDAIYQAQNRVIRRERSSQYEQVWSFFETYEGLTWVAFAVLGSFNSVFVC